jgi:hypothetical protein
LSLFWRSSSPSHTSSDSSPMRGTPPVAPRHCSRKRLRPPTTPSTPPCSSAPRPALCRHRGPLHCRHRLSPVRTTSVT